MTAEDFLLLPASKDGSKQELIRGEIATIPGPGFEHGEIQITIGSLIKEFLRKQKIGRVVSESGVRTERKPDTVRGPDISFYSLERVPLEGRIIGYHSESPDLCVEIVSPSNSKKELRTKIKEYFFAGVRMVWLVDPEDRSVTILRAPDEGRTLYDDARIDGGDVLPGFSCQVSELFN